jgi:hypothetical protein
MSYDDRLDVVEALLRNRCMMLDPQGRPTVGVALFGVAPTDEEFKTRAREIVDATGKDQRAAVALIDAFGEEVGERMVRAVEEMGRDMGIDLDQERDDLPPPPPA